VLDPYNPTGSTRFVNFTTSKTLRWDTRGPPPKSHLNWVVADSDWEIALCQAIEQIDTVRAYVKNQNLGFEVPYVFMGEPRRYVPDFILKVDDGRPDLLNLVIETKGYRGLDAQEKANAMRAYWIPGVNNLGRFGRWEFVELRAIQDIRSELAKLIARLGASYAA
jgi:type III restriction enzyme